MSESKYFFTGDLIKDDIKKIPKFATGGICNDAIFSKLDAFSQIDEIVKDIRNRQDNATAMEFTKCIGELLRKNGVVPKLTEYTRNFETDKTFEARFGVSIDDLDFSEHDKAFENEIAGLKAKIAIKDMDYKTASELLGKYQQENESLKQRIAELEDKIGDRDEINRCLREQIEELQKENEHLTEDYKVMSDFANKQMQKCEQLKSDIDKMATSKSEWIDKAVEWQQKCEKLEGRETENTVEVRVPASPIEIATHLINNTCTINELKMIAEHINVYCNGGN